MNLTNRIQSVILSNLRSPEKRRIGVEVECIFYNDKFQRLPVNPGEQFSATDFLNEMKTLQKNDNPQAGYSLEPGGQFEWASSPFISLHDLNDQFLKHFKRLMQIIDKHNLLQINLSLEPIYHPLDIELIKEEKYQLMHQRFTTTGELGPWMMCNTASIQINIDVVSREDAEIMAYLADCLEPFCAILFANSPFMAGKLAGDENLRYKIWDDTERIRCGNLMDHGIIAPEGLLERFSRHVQSVPAIFIYNRAGEAVPFDKNLGEWLTALAEEGNLQDSDIQVALHQVFTHVRFKDVLEVRGADRPPMGYELAPVAFWTGLLTTEKTREQVLKLVQSWSLEERRQLNQGARILDLDQITLQGRTLRSWLREIGDLALAGLDERSRALGIRNERQFLEPFFELFFSKGIVALQVQQRFIDSGMALIDFLKTEGSYE